MKENWTYKKLGEVVTIIMGQSPSSDTYNESEGLPFFQGNADFGEVYPNVRIYCNAPIRIANNGDVLISVRAPIGAINIADRKCCIGRGLAAIRGNEKNQSRFIYYLLLASKEKLVAQGTGSTFKSIGKDTLYNLLMPFVSLETQSRIVSELDLLQSIIDKQKAQVKELDNLAQAVFYDMFGDPVENDKGWEVKKLGEVGTIARGVSKHRPRNAPELLGNYIPFIQTGDIANSGMYITDCQSGYSELGVAQSKIWHKGTLCITIAANIGKCAIMSFDACFPDSVVGFIENPNVSTVVYVYYYFRCIQQALEDNAMGVAQKNINLGILNDMGIPVPPLSLQQSFATKIESIEKQKAAINQSIVETQRLFDYTMDKYFG